MNTTRTAITLALTTVLSSAGAAVGGENPFSMQVLTQGYQVVETEGMTHEGKCGAKKVEEAKCGANKAAAEEGMSKAKEGKCGAGKAAEEATDKAKEGKCGAGK